MNDLNGKVAVVLGASASGGTGWAIAKALADAGARVVIAARRLQPLEDLAATIDGTAVACDANSEAQVAALADRALDTYGALDIAVNSAGAAGYGFVKDASLDVLQEAINLHYFGHVYFVRHMARAMGTREEGTEGSIVCISSMTTTHTCFPNFPYAAAKSATDCMVRYAALEYAPRRIRVNSIRAAAIMSDLAKPAFAVPGMREAFCKEVPFGRLGEPRDFANAVLWLAGPAYVTGLNLQVNGGNHLTRFPYLFEQPQGVYPEDFPTEHWTET